MISVFFLVFCGISISMYTLVLYGQEDRFSSNFKVEIYLFFCLERVIKDFHKDSLDNCGNFTQFFGILLSYWGLLVVSF